MIGDYALRWITSACRDQLWLRCRSYPQPGVSRRCGLEHTEGSWCNLPRFLSLIQGVPSSSRPLILRRGAIQTQGASLNHPNIAHRGRCW
jgi:hypothetical protein